MLEEKLKEWFGFSSFNPGQKEIIESIVNKKDTLGILPTGSGKSLCYQMPTYMKGKPTLIISPLISLMDDQVMQLKAQGENLLLLFIQAWMKMKTTKYKFVTQKSLCFKSRIYFTNTKL